MDRQADFDDAIPETSLYDEDEADRAEFLAPSPVDPLYALAEHQKPEADTATWVEAFCAATRVKMLEELLPCAVVTGAYRRLLIAASAAEATRMSRPCSPDALTQALVFTHEKTSPGVSLGLEIFASRTKALVRPGAGETWQDRLLSIWPEFDVDVLQGSPLDQIQGLYEEVARTRSSQAGESTAVDSESIGLAQILDLNRPLMIETRNCLDMNEDPASALHRHSIEAESVLRRLGQLWAFLPSPLRNGTDPVVRRVAIMAIEEPGLSVPTAATTLVVSKPAVRHAIAELCEHGFLHEMTRRGSWRYWRA